MMPVNRPEPGIPLSMLLSLLWQTLGDAVPVPVTWDWITADASKRGARWGVTPDEFERVRGMTVEQMILAICDPRRNWPT